MRSKFLQVKHFLKQRVTPVGKATFLVAIIGLILGLIFSWVEFLVAGVFAAFLLILALPFLFGQLPHSVEFSLVANRVVAGAAITAQLLVTNTGKRLALPVSLDLPARDTVYSFHVKALQGGAVFKENVHIPGQSRGVLILGPAQVVRSDPLNIFRREKHWDKKYTVYIHPKTVVLPTFSTGATKDLEGFPSQNLVSDDLSFHAIREYRPGDLRRQIHWKSTAKTGQLMVKQFEETRRSKLLLILDTDSNNYRDSSEFELAVSGAASFGLLGLRESRQLDVLYDEGVDDGRAKTVHHKPVQPERLLDSFSLLKNYSRQQLVQEKLSLKTSIDFAAKKMFDVSLTVIVTGSRLNAKDLQLICMRLPQQSFPLIVQTDIYAKPSFKTLQNNRGSINVLTIGILTDLPTLMTRLI